MQPGRDLDAAIAKKLGWSVIDGRWYPHYSTNDGTALGLLEEIGLMFHGYPQNHGWRIYLYRDDMVYQAVHETLPGAIALACARALGVEE